MRDNPATPTPGRGSQPKRLIGLVLLILAGVIGISAVIGISSFLGPTEFVVILAIAGLLAFTGHRLRSTPATSVIQS